MTTKVTVSAQCEDTEEVMVIIKDTTNITVKTTRLQNGEVQDFYVYDSLAIVVKEITK